MEQDKLHNQVAQAKMWAMIATIISMVVLGVTFYFGTRPLKMPKPMKVPVFEMTEMTFTKDMQGRMFTRHEIAEIKFEWRSSARNDTTALSLVAIGGYMEGDSLVWDEVNKVPLNPGKIKYYADADRYNDDSPLYYSLEDIKEMQRISEGGPIDPTKIIVDISMIPSTSSDPSRRYCLYYYGWTVYESRAANPAPPFSSIGSTL